jgi:signal transduction histidine kinase
MERLVDKAIVLLCCLPSLALVAVDAQCVAMLLVSVTATCAFEASVLVPSEAGRAGAGGRAAWRFAFPLACCALCCALPAGAPFCALAAYDLMRADGARPLALVALVPVLLAMPALPATVVAISLCSCVAATTLSARSGRSIAQRRQNLRERDMVREQALKLEEANRDLADRQEYEARLATLAERSRLARDIHDNVGHLITRALMQTEALKVVHADDPEVKAQFSSVASTLDEALSALRSSVHALADDSCDLSVQLRHAAESSCEGTGLACACDIAAAEAPPQVTACLLAVMREAVSNSLRHAEGATRIRVELVEHPGMWRLVVDDDGRPPSRFGGQVAPVALAPEGGIAAGGLATDEGMGLRSMSERVRALGGTLAAGFSREAGGFRVLATIPRAASAGAGARDGAGSAATREWASS